MSKQTEEPKVRSVLDAQTFAGIMRPANPRTVREFLLDEFDNVVEMPRGSVVLGVYHNDVTVLYALIDPDQPLVRRRFALVGVGEKVPTLPVMYCGMVDVDGHGVQHVFEHGFDPRMPR